MRILVVNQHYWPEIAATAQLLGDLCEDLVIAGHHVTVVTGQPGYRSAAGRFERLKDTEIHHGVEIHRVPAYTPERRTPGRRLVHYVSFFLLAELESFRLPRFDVALVLSTPPLLLGLTGSLLATLRGTPFVYSVQDLYPDIAVKLGVLGPGGVSRAIGAAADWLYRRATRVVALSAGMAERLAAKGVEQDRIVVIPNWADTEWLRPSGRANSFVEEHRLQGRFVVLYSGNVGLSQGLECLPEAASRLVDLPIVIVVVGDGNAREGLEREVRRRQLENFRFVSPQPRPRLNEVLAACDLGMVTMKQNLGHELVPSKLYGIMAAGRPTLAAVGPATEVARVLTTHGCGIVVPPEDPGALASAIRRAREDRERLEVMGRRAREACEAEYSRAVCTSRYLRLLEVAAGPTPDAKAGV